MNMDVISQEILWTALKWGMTLALLLYIGFALVVLRQVTMMTDTLDVGFEKPVRFLAYVHLLFAIITFLSAFLLL